MVLMMESFSSYCLYTHCCILMVKCFAFMRTSYWDLLMVKCLELYLASRKKTWYWCWDISRPFICILWWFNVRKIKDLLLGDSVRYIDGKELGSDKGIKLGLSVDKMLQNVFRNVDRTTHGLDIGTDMGPFRYIIYWF